MANRTGHRLLTNADVRAYIDEERERMQSERLATAREVMEMLTAVMRGEIGDINGREVTVSDRLRAAMALLRRYGSLEDDSTPPLIIDDSDTVS